MPSIKCKGCLTPIQSGEYCSFGCEEWAQANGNAKLYARLCKERLLREAERLNPAKDFLTVLEDWSKSHG